MFTPFKGKQIVKPHFPQSSPPQYVQTSSNALLWQFNPIDFNLRDEIQTLEREQPLNPKALDSELPESLA
jgi:hypothetical protein